jgi:hypothetical protein
MASFLLVLLANGAALSCSLLVDTKDLSQSPAGQGNDPANDDGGVRGDASPVGDAALVTPTESGTAPGSSIAFVQAREGDVGSGLSLAVTFGSDVRAHDAIIVCVSIYTLSVTLTGIHDTRGNTFTTIVGPFDANGTRHYLAFAADVVGGSDTVTATVSGNPSPYLGMHIHEYSGLARQGAFDVGSAAAGASKAVDGMQSGAKSTTADHELIFGYGVSSDTAYPGAGYTARSGFSTGDVTEDKVVSVRGSYQTTATMTVGSYWEMLMATFRGE